MSHQRTWREAYLEICCEDEVPPRNEVLKIKASKIQGHDDEASGNGGSEQGGDEGPGACEEECGTIQLNGNCAERFTSRVHDCEAQALCKVLMCGYNIVEIDLSYNHLQDASATAIANVLKQNSSIQHLNLAQNDIGEVGAKAVADALMLNMALISLSLRSNAVGDAAGCAFGTMLRSNNTLQALDLGGCELDTKSLVSMYIALQHQHSLRSLNVDKPVLRAGPQETHSVVQHLSKTLLRNNTLVELSMNYSKLCDDHLAVLCPSLISNDSVVALSVVGNKLTVDGMRQLAAVLTRRSDFVSLNLTGNPLDEEGGIALASAIRSHPSLERLSILSTRLGDRALCALAEAIASSRSLREVYLWDQNDFTGANAARVLYNHREQLRRQLDVLDVDWYRNVDGEPAICHGDGMHM